MKRRRRKRPIIQIHRRYRPLWIKVFSWAVLLGWPLYAGYVRILYPVIHGHSYYEDWVEENFPELDVFDRRRGPEESPVGGSPAEREQTRPEVGG